MLDPRVAGVAFSADPVSGRRCVIIEADAGLGEKVVRGSVRPDRYIVDGRGILELSAPKSKSTPLLQKEQAESLAHLVRKIEGRMGSPQDVEWAWDGENFSILQARPITSLVGKHVYSRRIVADMSPGLVTPLQWSTNARGMTRNVFARMFTALIGTSDFDFTRLITRHRSRIYADMTLFGELLEMVGLPANFFEMITREERAARRRPPLTLRLLATTPRLLLFTLKHSRPACDAEDYLRLHAHEMLLHRSNYLAVDNARSIMRRLEHLLRLHGRTQWYVFLCAMNTTLRIKLLGHLVSRWSREVEPLDLIRGLKGMKTLEPNRGLEALARTAHSLVGDELPQLLTRGNDEIRRELSASEPGRRLLREFDAFMRRYGYLSPDATDLTSPAWVENPDIVWEYIGRLASAAPAPRDRAADDVRERSRRLVREALGPFRRALFEQLLSSTITHIDLRDRMSMRFSENAYEIRRLILDLAAHCVAEGILSERDDVFFLYLDEIHEMIGSRLQADDIESRVKARREELAADAEIEPEETTCGKDSAVRPQPMAPDMEYLVGIGSSPGTYRGFARLLRNPSEDLPELTADDVLVVPFTDIGWTPLFARVGAVVAETGGILSHTSIVAREYGLPAVVSVEMATQRIRDGQLITVDGRQGRVYLSHDTEEGGRQR
jgi:pyruvate,water dikinase